ncbi:MAG: TIGR00725 family protein [Candidatus Scalindua sp.]|nr:TIGR00725 family protein [Candidatus Scalindua sp.]
MTRKICISVIGSGSHEGDLDEEVLGIAKEVGREIALRGAVLVCGGLGGVMLAAAKGAKDGGGITVGLVPGENPDSANPYIDISLPTGLGHARNVLVAYSGDAVIAISGSLGTLSEISFALMKEKPIIGIGTWDLNELAHQRYSDKISSGQQYQCPKDYGKSVIQCTNAKEAVSKAFMLIRDKSLLFNSES